MIDTGEWAICGGGRLERFYYSFTSTTCLYVLYKYYTSIVNGKLSTSVHAAVPRMVPSLQNWREISLQYSNNSQSRNFPVSK